MRPACFEIATENRAWVRKQRGSEARWTKDLGDERELSCNCVDPIPISIEFNSVLLRRPHFLWSAANLQLLAPKH